MKWFPALAISCQIAVTLAAPAPNRVPSLLGSQRSGAVEQVREPSRTKFLRAIVANANQSAVAAANGAAANGAAANGAAANAGGEEGGEEGNENNVNGTFNQAIQLGGGNVKTDVLFPQSVS